MANTPLTGCFGGFLARRNPSNAGEILVEGKEAIISSPVGAHFDQIAPAHHPTPTVSH